jgi:hypothetical protein
MDIAEKQRQPCAVCTYCGNVSHDITRSNQPCGRELSRGKRCKGSYGSAINIGDWEECPACHGYGWVGSQTCDQCTNHCGWLYVRGMSRR